MNRLFFGFLLAAFTLQAMAAKGVQVVPDEAHQRVGITIDGKPFTSYVWPSTLKKPVLFPLITADGIDVVRGFPLAPRPGERVDHPHHAGIWFNYGDANGFDFWNNSDAIKPEERAKMGTIHQQKILSTKSGRDSGELVVDSLWTTGAGQNILEQKTRYVFSQKGNQRRSTWSLRCTRSIASFSRRQGRVAGHTRSSLVGVSQRERWHLYRREWPADGGCSFQYTRRHRCVSDQ